MAAPESRNAVRLDMFGAENSHSERLNTALAARYRVERELGQGGMATVYTFTP